MTSTDHKNGAESPNGPALTSLGKHLIARGASFAHRPNGQLALSNVPRAQFSNSNFLSEEFTDWQASQTRK